MIKKTRSPQQNRSIQTRERIVIAALELFSEKGYHSTNSKEIAARANTAIGSFYAYFKNKNELFIEAFKYYCRVIEKELFFTINDDYSPTEEINEWEILLKNFPFDKDNGEKLRIIISNLVKTHSYYPGFTREITVMRLLDPDIKKIIEDHEMADLKNFTNLIKSMGSDIRIKDAEIAANIIFRTLEVIIHETLLIPSMNDKLERIIDETTDMIYRYIFDS